jgi:pimeloyl-ACP methyl ester carboxylesterase
MTERLAPPALPDWLAHELPFVRYRVDLKPYRMHVMEAGDGPTVLMVHGNPTWGYLYRKVVRELSDGQSGATTGPWGKLPYRVVLPDPIGLGLSDKPYGRCEHTLEAHAKWLGDLIDRLELEDITLVVQDWGGPIGALAMAVRPERLRALVVLNTVLGPPKPGFRPTAFHRFSQTPMLSTLAFQGLGFPQRMLAAAQGDRTSISGQTAKAYRWPLRKLRDRKAPLALARMVPDSQSHPSIAGLKRVHDFASSYDGPAAIVWGDNDPVLGSVRTFIERTLPHASVRRTQAGHFLQEEVPGDIADAIREVTPVG